MQATSTLSFEGFQNGFEFQHYGYASAVSYVMVIAAAIGITLLLRVVRVRRDGRRSMSGRASAAIVSYVVLVLIGLVGIAPFVYLLVLSFKSRLDVLTRAARPALRLGDDPGELPRRHPRRPLRHVRRQLDHRDRHRRR